MTLERDDVAALPHGDDGRVAAEACRIDADDDRGRLVLLLRAGHGVVDDVDRHELVVAFRRKLAVHFDVGLIAVRAVLVDDLLIQVLVGAFDVAGVDVAGAPERPLGVERLVEIAGVAARVREGKVEAVGRVLGKEALRDRPDRVGDTAGFVEDQHDAVEVMHTGVRVRVFLRPQPAFDRPVARALLHVAFDDLGQPLGRHDARRGDFEPMAVDGHGQPLGDLGPCDRPQLRFGVSRHDGRRSDAGREHPVRQPTDQRRLADTAPGSHSLAQRVKVDLAVVVVDVVAYARQDVALPFARAGEMLQRRAFLAPWVGQENERQWVILNGRRPQPRHEFHFLLRGIDWRLH